MLKEVGDHFAWVLLLLKGDTGQLRHRVRQNNKLNWMTQTLNMDLFQEPHLQMLVAAI